MYKALMSSLRVTFAAGSPADVVVADIVAREVAVAAGLM